MEMIAFCEDRIGRLEHAVKRQSLIEQQLRERLEWETGPTDKPKQTMEELRAEMRGRGVNMGGPAGHSETAATVKTKLGLTDAEWDAIPQADPGKWQRLVEACREAVK